MDSVTNFLIHYQTALGVAGIGILDFAFALNKNLEANGILHAIYLFLKGQSSSS